MSNLQDISSSLSSKYGLSETDAKAFIKTMFCVVTDELEKGTGASVKIKGLGTFKVIVTNARSTASSDKGRTVIDGRNKITFTPDTILRDRVNGPFAQFETIILNGYVDFSDIDNETLVSNSESNDIQKCIIDTENELCSDTTNENTENVVEQFVEIAGNGNTSEMNPDNVEPDAIDNFVIPRGESEIQTEAEPECYRENNSFSEQENASTIARELMHEKYPNKQSSQQEKELVTDDECKTHRHHFGLMMLSLVTFVLMLAGIVGLFIYNYYQESNVRLQKLESKILKHSAKKNTNANLRTDTVLYDSTASNKCISYKKDSVKSMETDEITTSKFASQQTYKSTNMISQDYDSDPRIRTGAYIIVGIDKVVKINKGQTIVSISKLYLGEGMECYVEAVNDYKQLKAGDSIKIPKVKLKPRRH